MSYTSAISNILNDTLHVNTKKLIGEEKCGDVVFKSNGRFVLLNLDCDYFKNNFLHKIFKDGNIKCICDYVVISEDLVLLCEMKSGSDGNMKIQLQNTKRFIEYLLLLAKEHFSISQKLPEIKYVCFAFKHLEKINPNKPVPITNDKVLGKIFRLPCNVTYNLNQF